MGQDNNGIKSDVSAKEALMVLNALAAVDAIMEDNVSMTAYADAQQHQPAPAADIPDLSIFV